MAASDDLIQHVYDYFLKSYHEKTTDSKGGEFIVFEAAGFAPGCVSSADGGANAALQEVSRIADVVPEIDNGIYSPTGRTISFQYSGIITAAQPASSATISLFSSCKAQAGKLYQDATSNGELDGPKATFATPSDWWNSGNAGNWTSYSYNAAAEVSSPPPPPPAVGPRPPRLMWRVVEPEAHLESWERLPQTRPNYLQTAGPATRVISRSPFLAAESFALRPESTRVTFAPAALAVASPAVKAIPVSLAARAAVTQLVAQTVPHPVETASFTLSFDYCLVHLRRPWLSGDFLAMSGWYVPGTHAGDYASGAPANTGWFSALPMAFIAVKNLLINGSWSANDLAVASKSAAFGPFALASAGASGTLTNPGVQIIAWICSQQPKLPPDSDPSLSPPA